jgi:hypothetical protein
MKDFKEFEKLVSSEECRRGIIYGTFDHLPNDDNYEIISKAASVSFATTFNLLGVYHAWIYGQKIGFPPIEEDK